MTTAGKVWIGFWVALIVLISGGLLGYFNMQRLREAESTVNRSNEVIASLESLLSTLKDAETGQRGYLLTGNDSYLEPYNAATEGVRAELASLVEVKSYDPVQSERIEKLKSGVDAKLDELAATIDLNRSGRRDEALAIVRGDSGKRVMDDLRRETDAIEQTERELLENHARDSESRYIASVASLIVTSAAGIGALGLVFFLSRRNERHARIAADVVSEQRERLRTTLASIGDAVISTDRDGRVTYLNEVAESLTGWKNNEAAGLPLAEIFRIVNETTRATVENPAERALRDGAIVGLANHTVLIAKDGTEHPIDDSAAPIRCAKNEVVGCVLVFRDITERRWAERALRQAHSDLEQRVAERTTDLTNTNAFLNALLENLQEGIVACDADGVLTLFNQSTREFHGLPEEKLPADQWAEHYDLFHADGVTKMSMEDVPLFRALRGEQVKDAEMVIAPKGGERRILLASGRAISNDQGKLLGAVVSMHDITRRRTAESALRKLNEDLETRVDERTAAAESANEGLRAEMAERRLAEDELGRSEHRMRFIMASMPQKIFTARPDGNIDYFNPQWTEYTGLTFEQIRDWGWTQFIHPDDVDENVRVWKESVETGEKFHFEHRFRRHDGVFRWHFSRAVALKDPEGKVLMWIGSNTDIHEQKRNANELRQLAANLSEADRRKNEFLAVLAHELRNPLAPIRNALHLMRLTGEQDKTLRSAAEMMERQVGQLVHLVDDLLDVSRISRGKIELRREKVELASIVRHAVEAARPSCETGGVELAVSLPRETIYLDADPTRLNQVIGNLLNNACKFTDRGGKIDLTVEPADGRAAIGVRDTGIGIAPEQIPYLFDMFVQADTSLERSAGGLGIGLTLVKNLVEMHGGTVEARSEGLGRGSEFIIRLPIMSDKPKSEPQLQPAADGNAQGPQRRILVVDDNTDSAESLSLLLKINGHEVRTAHDGEAAVQTAGDFRPDVILLDIGLPKLNGYEAARKIREQPWGVKMVLMALTGWGQEEDRQKSKDAGFDAHLVKPIDYFELERLLNEIY